MKRKLGLYLKDILDVISVDETFDPKNSGGN